jgi:hypothetical protein
VVGLDASIRHDLDSLLTAFDLLEHDPKLSIVEEIIRDLLLHGERVAVVAQSIPTLAYLREHLFDSETAEPLVLLRSTSIVDGGRLFESEPRLFGIADTDLSRLAEAPGGYVHIWMDMPSSVAIGARRLELVPSANGLVIAVVAQPLMGEASGVLSQLGFMN